MLQKFQPCPAAYFWTSIWVTLVVLNTYFIYAKQTFAATLSQQYLYVFIFANSLHSLHSCAQWWLGKPHNHNMWIANTVPNDQSIYDHLDLLNNSVQLHRIIAQNCFKWCKVHFFHYQTFVLITYILVKLEWSMNKSETYNLGDLDEHNTKAGPDKFRTTALH